MGDAADSDGNISGQRRSDRPDAIISRLADRQHTVVAGWQLVVLGVARYLIDYRVKAGRLFPHHRDVYSVGCRTLTREGRLMAAVLAGGPGAALSHRSAADLWGIHSSRHGAIEVTVPRERRGKPPVAFHSSALPADETTSHDAIPVTTVPRTLFDLAAVLRPRQLERALNEAEALRLWDDLSLADLLSRYPRRRGAPAIRALLEARQAGETITRSELERRFLEFVDAAGLPEPETNVIVEGFEVDCVWREARVVVELDSRAFHLTRAAFEADRERDRVLQVAGWRAVRVTAAQLDHSASRLASDLRRLLGRATLTA